MKNVWQHKKQNQFGWNITWTNMLNGPFVITFCFRIFNLYRNAFGIVSNSSQRDSNCFLTFLKSSICSMSTGIAIALCLIHQKLFSCYGINVKWLQYDSMHCYNRTEMRTKQIMTCVLPTCQTCLPTSNGIKRSLFQLPFVKLAPSREIAVASIRVMRVSPSVQIWWNVHSKSKLSNSPQFTPPFPQFHR